MPTQITGEWVDCFKALPYRDCDGKWRLPSYTQRRKTMRDGHLVTEYREREETHEEWCDRQW